MKKFLLTVLVAFCLTASVAQSASFEAYEPPESGSVRIVRDRYGVPHIIARDDRSLFFGAGYAQAEDQLENLVENYLRAQGRIAEREGVLALRLDHLIRLLRVPQRAEKHYQQLKPKYREHLDAFAAGVNAYIAEHRESVPDWIEPVQPQHVLAFADYVETLFCISHCIRDLEQAGIKLAGLEPIAQLRAATVGSNQFAVRPERSQSGAAMLSMDPHLPHNGFFRWYEMHLVSPNINCMGACFFGSPYVSMGRTQQTAWCMTVNGPDLGDVFALELDPDDPTRFKGPSGWEKLEIGEETYRVRNREGLREVTLPVRRSSVGPVVTTKDGVAYAFALPLSNEPLRAGQIYNMARATNVDEFRRALSPLGLVMFNIVYADASGDIFYISNARVPKRDTRIDSHQIRPASEAWAHWQGFHTLDELPQVKNPPSGYLMNTNSGPQNVCPSAAPRPEDYPPYMISQQNNSRSLRLRQLLDPDTSISWQEMHTYATDTYLIGADDIVPQIVRVIDEQGDQFQGDVETLRQVGKVLAAWNRRTDLDSRGAVLFIAIVTDKAFRTAVKQKDTQAAAKALVEQAKKVRERFGRLDVEWAQFSRIRRGDIERPVAGNGLRQRELASLKLTALRPTYGRIEDGRRWCTGGSSYGMIVDFSGETRSISCLPFGVSEDPDSPHFADQLVLYAKRQYKPAWFLPDEIREHAESDQVLKTPFSPSQ